MKNVNMNALSGTLIERVFRALGSTEMYIRKFGDIAAINKTHMVNAQREFGKVEAYMDILKIVSEETYRSIVSSKMYMKTAKLILETENQLSRY